jgi:hypothetical protein
MKWSAAVRRTSSENLSFITSSTKTVYAIFRVLVLQMRCSSIDDSRGKMEVQTAAAAAKCPLELMSVLLGGSRIQEGGRPNTEPGGESK